MRGMRSLELGVQAIKEGNRAEGARLLRMALRDESMTANLRATTYMWMAETSDDREFKIQCYNDALRADPANQHATQRLSLLLSIDLPPVNQQDNFIPPPAAPTLPGTGPLTMPGTGPLSPMATPIPGQYPPVTSQPAQTRTHTPTPPYVQPVNDSRFGTGPLSNLPSVSNAPPNEPTWGSGVYYRTVGILDGPHGTGTAFFINRSGLLATTRHVVTGRENVTVELEPGRHLLGKVVRSYGEYDLALVKVDVNVNTTPPFSDLKILPDNLEITAYGHTGGSARGRVRGTVRSIKQGWFPTTLRHLPDAGGNPVFDERHDLVGMLTRNAGRSSSEVYGLHIAMIRDLAEKYQIETNMDPNRAYCPSCGHRSRASLVGAYYCESCGSTLPQARSVERRPQKHADTIYNENVHRPCPHCQSKVGYYNGFCLRCGREPI